MKRSFYWILIPAAVMVASCKTVHPAGIYEKAPATNAQNQASTVISSPTVSSNVPSTPSVSQNSTASAATTSGEDVRKESFTLAPTETNQNPIHMKYNVVVGSFENQSNAQRLEATLKAEGKNPSIVINSKGMYRVIIESYNDYAQATQVKLSLQNRFPGAWLLVQANQ
ncbi:MAG: SPOR domain-containing protein [Microbacter sp.]